MEAVHVPILVQTISDHLLEPFLRLPAKAERHWFVDCTLGGGGHTAAILDKFEQVPELQKHCVLAVDRDPEAIERAKIRFARQIEDGRLELFHSSFGQIESMIRERPVLGLLADLGLSSDQLESQERGFSFKSSGTLDMRFDTTRGLSCQDYLKRLSARDLEKIIKDYGEERFAKRIAEAIVDRRNAGEFPQTASGLAELIRRAVPPPARHGRLHPATRTFQALRIFVNGELEEVDALLDKVILDVRSGGRIGILSFHSLEDRRVKLRFKDRTLFRQLTKKPICPEIEEIHSNPRSKSAKLRLVERI